MEECSIPFQKVMGRILFRFTVYKTQTVHLNAILVILNSIGVLSFDILSL